MDEELPFQLGQQRDALIREIYAAFEGVSRVGGVSWSEARAIDRYGSDTERKQARKSDREANWQGLVDSPDWPGTYGSEWCFLDGPGFLYYLAPALVRLVRSGDDCEVQFHLTYGGASNDYSRRYVELMDDRQKRCVRRVTEYVIALEEWAYEYALAKEWREAYESYWASLPPLDEENR